MTCDNLFSIKCYETLSTLLLKYEKGVILTLLGSAILVTKPICEKLPQSKPAMSDCVHQKRIKSLEMN